MPPDLCKGVMKELRHIYGKYPNRMAKIFTQDFNIMLGTQSGSNKSPKFLSFDTNFTNIF